jgi:hypothetical protein
MKTLRSRQYSLKQLSQFTMLNKLLGHVASNIHDSLTRATRNLPFACMGYFAKVVFLTHENAER